MDLMQKYKLQPAGAINTSAAVKHYMPAPPGRLLCGCIECFQSLHPVSFTQGGEEKAGGGGQARAAGGASYRSYYTGKQPALSCFFFGSLVDASAAPTPTAELRYTWNTPNQPHPVIRPRTLYRRAITSL